jgi:hypothetical protein
MSSLDPTKPSRKAPVDPWLVGIALTFAAILLAHADFVPMFDGRIYADCVVDAARAHLAPSQLQCAGHPDYAFMLLLGLPQMLAPTSFVPMLVANVLLGVLTIFAFHATLAFVVPSSGRVERLLATAALALNPVVVVDFLNVNPDNAVLAFFTLCMWALVSGRLRTFIALGLALCFSKESGVLLYALLVAVHVWLDAASTPGGMREKLRALLPAVRYSIPLVAFVATLQLRRLSGAGMWKGETPTSITGQLLSFKIDDDVFHSYLTGIFVMHFEWIPSILVGAYLLDRLVRALLRVPSPEEAPDVVRARRFAITMFVATAYLLTRYRTFTNPRYWMPVYPTLFAVLLLAAEQGLRSVWLRRGVLGAFTGLTAISNFVAIDPITLRAFGTFDFGRHDMLDSTSISHECCGRGRDQLFYNLQATELHYVLDRVFASIRPTAGTDIVVPFLGSWYNLGPLEASSFHRTLRRDGTVEPRYSELPELARRPEPLPAELYYIGLPYLDHQQSIGWLSQRYTVASQWRAEHDGYWMEVLRFVKRPDL